MSKVVYETTVPRYVVEQVRNGNAAPHSAYRYLKEAEEKAFSLVSGFPAAQFRVIDTWAAGEVE